MEQSDEQETRTSADEPPLPEKTRLQVVRDIAVFQVKLFVDGFRDLLLSPISLILGMVSVLVSKRPGEPFYRLLRVGRASEDWIDLFGDAYPDATPQGGNQRRERGLREIERNLRALESNLTTEDYDQGARESLARVRKTLAKISFRKRGTPGDTDDTADRTRQDNN